LARIKFPSLHFRSDDLICYSSNLSCHPKISLETFSGARNNINYGLRMKQFLIKSTNLTIILYLLGTIFYMTVLKAFYLSVLPFTVFFFYLITNLVHAYLIRITGKSSARFTSQYMAVSFLKMFFYLASAILYLIFDRENAKSFIVAFLLLYVIYTVFEVREFLKLIIQKK
jgi:hypothetical protein